MRYFPIYVDLEGRRVVVAGGGEAALQKLRLVLRTGAEVLVVAEQVSEEIAQLAAAGRVRLASRAFAPADLAGAALAYAATGDEAADDRIAAAARAAGVPVNAVDRADISDFLTPAIVDRDPVTVAIGTEGTAPVLARAIKARIESLLPGGIGPLARLAASWRERVARRLADPAARRRLWQRFFAGAFSAPAGRHALTAAEIRLEALLGAAEAVGEGRGRVSLVGAGPGDPELLTLRARRRLHEADVVVYDRLVDARILELARREAKFISVGKTPGGHGATQERINDILVAQAGKGLDVVRLKGGDPVVFGRADEEIAALTAAGIDTDIVPGITAASAAAAAAGVSLTRRGRNTSFRFLTGHDAAGLAEHDWRALAGEGASFAAYMSLKAAPFLESRLLANGADPATPAIVVENASRPDERVVRTRLADLAATLEAEAVTGPAIILVGLDAPAIAAGRVSARALERAALRAGPALAMGGL